MRIAILLPMVWSVRNVVHGGVLHALARAGVESHVIVWDGGRLVAPAGRGQFADADLFRDAVDVHPLIEPPGHTPRGKAFVDAVLTSAFQRRHRICSYGIYRHWFSRHDGPLLRARATMVEGLGWLAASRPGMNAIEHVATRWTQRSRDLGPVIEQLRAIEPDLIWSTVNVSSREQPYRLAARALGIPVVTSILSFDNLTSRGPLPRDDHYLVWGVRMKTQLLRFYPQLVPQQVTITGTPQFDFHRRREFLWTRQRTLRALGLDWRRRYLLYAASHASLTPEEPALVAQLAARMGERPALADHALILRLHPLDEPARWRAVLRDNDRLHLSSPFASTTIADGWALPTRDDHARLTSSLAHADACLNVASTMSLDAAILDRPVICIDFTAESDSPRDMLYAEYAAEHYAPLVASGGLRLAHSWRELLDQIELAVEHPERDRDRRAHMVKAECGNVDGCAAQRVARALILLARERSDAPARITDERSAEVRR